MEVLGTPKRHHARWIRRLLCLMSVITGGSASNVGLAETAVQAWVQTLNAPNHSGFNYAYKVAVDGNGNVIVAGCRPGAVAVSVRLPGRLAGRRTAIAFPK